MNTTKSNSPGWRGRPSSLRAQAARRLAIASLAVLLVASALGAAAYDVVVSNSARFEAKTVENFYGGKLRELDEDWQRQAYRQKARLEFLGLADASSDRWSRLYGYFVAQGEEQQFSNVILLSGERKPLFWYGHDGDRLANLISDSSSSDWLYDPGSNRLYRCFHQSVWLGQDGMGTLMLLRLMDNALLYLNTSSRTGLRLEWQGRTVAESQRAVAPESFMATTKTMESSQPWPGSRQPAPVLHLSHVVEAPVSGMKVAAGVAVLLALQALCIWAALGRWIMKVGQRVSLLGQASRRFASQWTGSGKAPLALDGLVLARQDEIGDVALSLKNLTEAVAEHDAQRLAHQEELKGLRTMLSDIVDSMPSALITVDRGGVITLCNRRAIELAKPSGQDPAGRLLEDAFPRLDDMRGLLDGSMRDGKPDGAHKRVWLSGSEVRYEDVVLYPLSGPGLEGAVIRLDDVTERHRMEQIMIQSEKMLSVGGLAAGMAHEINNPLSGILQSAQVILRRLEPELGANRDAASRRDCSVEAVRGYLQERDILNMIDAITDSAKRASRIVSGMLEFSRRGESPFQEVDLGEVLDKAIELSSRDYDLTKRFDFKRIVIEREYTPGMPAVPCSPTQIEQVAMNLLRNAAQAMKASPQGRPPRIRLRSLLDGGDALFQVEDNGPGLDETARKRVFEPFYTTKAPGVGTGLGLSVSYFIVTQNHDGALSVESEPGAWTRFTVRLPLKPLRRGPAQSS